MIKVTEKLLTYLGFTLKKNMWIHEKGIFIYTNKLPDELKDLVNTMTGSAFKKGEQKAKNEGI